MGRPTGARADDLGAGEAADAPRHVEKADHVHAVACGELGLGRRRSRRVRGQLHPHSRLVGRDEEQAGGGVGHGAGRVQPMRRPAVGPIPRDRRERHQRQGERVGDRRLHDLDIVLGNDGDLRSDELTPAVVDRADDPRHPHLGVDEAVRRRLVARPRKQRDEVAHVGVDHKRPALETAVTDPLHDAPHDHPQADVATPEQPWKVGWLRFGQIALAEQPAAVGEERRGVAAGHGLPRQCDP